MQIDAPLALLGGLTPARFMRRHWQRKPLLVRGALPDIAPPIARGELFALAARDDVRSRLIVRDGDRWSLRHGPIARRALPPLRTRGWSLLVQGVDLHVPAAHELLQRFRFVPDARLDDLMVSFATDGGGVGAHVDSYDVFLVQVAGTRRWRIGRARDLTLRADVPLKLLERFEPGHEWLLEAGDLLYLPPQWAHDGEAVGEHCMTCSIGFRAPRSDELARELMLRLADAVPGEVGAMYRDRGEPAARKPARIPSALAAFAGAALDDALRDCTRVARALGEWLSEPARDTWFERAAGALPRKRRAVRLDARTRMLYDRTRLYINGEAHEAANASDVALLRRLADRRGLSAADAASLGDNGRALLDRWAEAGWLHASDGGEGDDEEGRR